MFYILSLKLCILTLTNSFTFKIELLQGNYPNILISVAPLPNASSRFESFVSRKTAQERFLLGERRFLVESNNITSSKEVTGAP